jgi:hypothetical protein
LDRGDVSAVNYGANPHTSIAARMREIMHDVDHLPIGAARAAYARLQHRDDLAPITVSVEESPAPIRAPEVQSDLGSVEKYRKMLAEGK